MCVRQKTVDANLLDNGFDTSEQDAMLKVKGKKKVCARGVVRHWLAIMMISNG